MVLNVILRKLKTWNRYLADEKLDLLHEFEEAIKLFERYVIWVTNEDESTEYEEYGDRLKIKAKGMKTEFAKTIASHIENRILMRLNGSTDKEKDRKELKTECETSFVSPARIKLSEIYFNEGKYEECAELLAPFCDMWLESGERSIDLWRVISKFVSKNEFIGAWEDIVDEDIQEYFNEVFQGVTCELDIDINTILQSDTNCICDNCDLCIINLMLKIGEHLMAD